MGRVAVARRSLSHQGCPLSRDAVVARFCGTSATGADFLVRRFEWLFDHPKGPLPLDLIRGAAGRLQESPFDRGMAHHTDRENVLDVGERFTREFLHCLARAVPRLDALFVKNKTRVRVFWGGSSFFTACSSWRLLSVLHFWIHSSSLFAVATFTASLALVYGILPRAKDSFIFGRSSKRRAKLSSVLVFRSSKPRDSRA